MTSRLVASIALVIALSGCAATKPQNWTRIDGSPCQTIHVNPVWYEGTTATTCMVNGKAEVVPTNQSDIGMLGVLPIATISLVSMILLAL